jgi:hypothetical protein
MPLCGSWKDELLGAHGSRNLPKKTSRASAVSNTCTANQLSISRREPSADYSVTEIEQELR